MFVPTEIGTKLGQLVVQACESKNLNPCNVGYLYDIKASALDVAISGRVQQGDRGRSRGQGRHAGPELLQPDRRTDAVQNMLAANANLNLIVGSDQGIEGGVKAVAAKHMTGKVILVGYGASAAALAGVASGAWYGDVAQAPASEGRLAVQALVQAVRTGQISGGSTRWPGCPTAASSPRPTSASSPPSGRAERARPAGPPRARTSSCWTSASPSAACGPWIEVSLTISRGSIHALVGENGAGKSTLGKIIAGVIAPDRGQLLIDGEPVTFHSPREAIARGIVLIAQELSIVPALTVAENVFLGTEPRRAGFVARRALRRRYDELAATAGFELAGDLPGRTPADGRPAEGGDPPRAVPRRPADRDGRADGRAGRPDVERLHRSSGGSRPAAPRSSWSPTSCARCSNSPTR